MPIASIRHKGPIGLKGFIGLSAQEMQHEAGCFGQHWARTKHARARSSIFMLSHLACSSCYVHIYIYIYNIQGGREEGGLKRPEADSELVKLHRCR